jgi:PAS domain S-box-containing protein
MRFALWPARPGRNGGRWRLLPGMMGVLAAASMLFLSGRMTVNDPLPGLLATAISALFSLLVLSRMFQEFARAQQQELSQRVRSAEARLQVALESSDEGVLMVAADGRVLSINLRFRELWRVPEELATAGHDALLLQHVLDQLEAPQAFLDEVQRLYGSDATAEDTLQFKDGRVFQRHTRALSLGDEEGRIWCFKDVTEQAHAVTALAEREEIYRTIVTQAKDAITLVDTQTLRFVEYNDAACESLGYTREEFACLSLPDIALAEEAQSVHRRLPQILATGIRNVETRHRHQDGSWRDVLLSLKGIELRGRARVVITWSDITERKQSELALREQEALYRAIVSQAAAGIDLIDVDSLSLIEVNDTGCRLLGYDREELVHQPLATIQAVLAGDALREAVNRVVQAGQASFENRHRCKDGRILDVQINARAIRLQGRDCLLGVWSDITERKRAETALRESRNLLQTIIDIAPVRVFWKDRNLVYLGCNPAFANDAGMAGPGEVIGKDDFRMAWADQAERYRADDRAVMASGVARLFYEEPQTTADGRTIWLCTSKVPLRNSGGEMIGVLGIYDDITERKQLADALQQREQYQRALLDNFPFMVWLKDEESRFLAVNQVFATVAGSSPEALIGQSDLDLWSLDLAESYRADDRAVLQSGQPKNVEEAIEIDGRRVWFETYKSPVRIAGKLVGTVGFGRDISERKTLEEELRQHREHLQDLVRQKTHALLATEAKASRILESTADGLFGVDLEGCVTFINPAGCRMLGYRAEEVIGRSAHDLFHHRRPDGSPFPVEECAGRLAWRAGQEMRFDDVTYWHADGSPLPVALATHPMFEQDRITGAVVSFVDISAQRAAALAREQALTAAENLARARSEFLANMSHEIRTPMNGVLGFAHIGHRHCCNSEKARGAFEKIIASGNQLLSVVNEILDFSKIDAGKLQIEATEMSLDDALGSALELVADRARAKGLQLRLEKRAGWPASCVSDPLRIAQLLNNLLSNAIKFTAAGGVTLTVSLQGTQLVFGVTDTGLGMSGEELAYVFDPFQQADGSTTRRFGGTGLGLAICKRLLELMQGEIQVQSTPGAGSRFEFRLPYVPPQAPEAALPTGSTEPAMPAKPLAGIAILVAEDDPVSRMILESNLLEDGARPVLVGDGHEAVERVFRDGPGAYDLVLMDIQMPVMDGYEATRRILTLRPELPIIGQTAHAFEDERNKCFAAGMAGHIAKPIDPQALVRLILQILEKRRKP